MPHVLSVGENRTLLHLRTSVLCTVGHHVVEAFTVSDAWSLFTTLPIDVAILCHTIPRDRRGKLASAMKLKSPAVPVIALYSGSDYITEADAAIDNLSGPQTLLDCIAALIAKPAGSATLSECLPNPRHHKLRA